MTTSCNLRDGATFGPALPALTYNLTANTTVAGRPDLPWPHTGGYLGGAPGWPRLELWSPPASHAVWPFIRVPAGLRLTLTGLTLSAYPPYTTNRTAFSKLLGPDVIRAALLPAVLALVRPDSDVLLGSNTASWEAPPAGPGGELALVNVTAQLPDCEVWEEVRQELCLGGKVSEKVQVFSDLIHIRSFTRYGLIARDVFVTCLNASATPWAGKQLAWPPPPPSPPPPMYVAWRPVVAGCAATATSASDLATVLSKANADELPMYDESQDDPPFTIRIRGAVRLSELLLPPNGSAAGRLANGTLRLRRAFHLWGQDTQGAVFLDEDEDSGVNSSSSSTSSSSYSHLDLGGLPHPFAFQLFNPPRNRAYGLRQLTLLLTGLTISGLAPGDYSTVPHGLLTALGWAFGINTAVIERGQSQASSPLLMLQDCVVVVGADELAYWRAMLLGLQQGGGTAADQAVIALSGISARQWSGWINSSMNVQVDSGSLMDNNSSNSLTLRYLYFAAEAFPTVTWRNVTLATPADPRAGGPSRPLPTSGVNPSNPNTTTASQISNTTGVSTANASGGEVASGGSAEQGATAWEPLWAGADDGWLLRLAAAPEAVLVDAHAAYSAAGATAADADGAARAATAAGWRTVPLSRVPTVEGNIPSAAWSTAFAAFVKDPSYLDDSSSSSSSSGGSSGSGSLPPPPPPQSGASAAMTFAAGATAAGAPAAGAGRSQPVFIQEYSFIRLLDSKGGGEGGKPLPPPEPPLPPDAPRAAGGINPSGGGGGGGGGIGTGGGMNTGAGVRRRRRMHGWRQQYQHQQQVPGGPVQWPQQHPWTRSRLLEHWSRHRRRALLGGGVGLGGGGDGGGDASGAFQALPVPGNVTLFGHSWYPTILDLSDMVGGLNLTNGSAIALRQLVMVGVAGGRVTRLAGALPDSGASGGKNGGSGDPPAEPPAEPPAPPNAPLPVATGGGKTPLAGARRSRRLQQASGTYRCAPGSYLDTATETCMACGPGSYQPDPNSTAAACSACPRGTFAPMAASAACSPCPPGLSSNEPGATDCADALWLPAAALLVFDFDRTYGLPARLYLRDVLMVLPEQELEVLLALAPKLSVALASDQAGGGNGTNGATAAASTAGTVVPASPYALTTSAAVAAAVEEVSRAYAGLLGTEAAVRALAELLLSSEFEVPRNDAAAAGNGGDPMGAQLVLRRMSYAGVRGVNVRYTSRGAHDVADLQVELGTARLPDVPPGAPEFPMPPDAPPSPPSAPVAPPRPPGPPRRLPPGVFQGDGGALKPPKPLVDSMPPPPSSSSGLIRPPPGPAVGSGADNETAAAGAPLLTPAGASLAGEAVGPSTSGSGGAAAAAPGPAPGSSSSSSSGGVYLQPWQAGVMVAGIVAGVAIAASLGGIILWNRCGPSPPPKARAPPPPPPPGPKPSDVGAAAAATAGAGTVAIGASAGRDAAVAGSSIELVDMSSSGQGGVRA